MGLGCPPNLDRRVGCVSGLRGARFALLASAGLFTALVPSYTAAATIVEVRVSASADDAEESASGSVNLASTDLELVTESTIQTVGIRFRGVSVPPGARVLSAHVQFQVDETGSASTSLTFQAEASDNALIFTSATRNISSRSRTGATVAWSPPAWPTLNQAGPDQRTPDLAPIIQQIVDRPGWLAGSALVIIVTGTGKRTAEAFDGLASGAPLLRLEYELAGVNLPPQVTIGAPADAARFEPGDLIPFSGTATDQEDGSLTGSLLWTSSLDGSIGSGGSFARSLSEGAHSVAATAADSAGLTGTDEVAVTVGAPTVTISVPQDGAWFSPGEAVAFAGSATDARDGDLTASLSWTSQLDGPIGSGGSFTRSDLSAGVHRIRARVTDGGGLSDEREVLVSVSADGPALVGAGDIASCSWDNDEATARLLDAIPGIVFTVGDNVYPDGTDAEFRDCYDPTWGRHRARTRPASGNHDYRVPGASGYFGYFGPAAGDPSKGYYSYDFAGWHIIVLNSECAQVGGCQRTSPQGQWLQADLAAHPAACTLAYWHRPLFSSGATYGGNAALRDFWQLLYEAGADVVLNGHEHIYERFGPQNSAGQADPGRGIREFIVGTGGAALYGLATPQPNSELRNRTTHGVLKLTLNASSYDWEFVPIAGGTFADSGSDVCFTTNAPPGVTITQPAVGSVFDVGLPVTFAGAGSDPEDGDVTASLAWTSSRDGAIGSGGSFVLSTLSRGAHVITATATDGGGLSGSAQVSITINGPPVVTISAPTDGATFPAGVPVSFSGSASDMEQGNLTPDLVWTSSLTGAIGSGGSFTRADLPVGPHLITASVTDGGGLQASHAVSITLLPNTSPAVSIVAPADGAAFSMGSPVTFTGNASDAEDGDLTRNLVWTSNQDGAIGLGGCVATSTLSRGVHVITATVSDSSGAPRSAQISVTIDGPPTVAITAPKDGSTFSPGVPVSFAGFASDLEDGDLTAGLAWASSLNGSLGQGGSLTRSDLSLGTHTISASVSDRTGKLATAAISLSIVQRPLVTLDKRVAAGTDDAEEQASGSVWLSSSDLELVTDGSVQKVGVRFVGMTIPRGARVRAAHLQFQADEQHTGATSLTIQGQSADNPAVFSTAKFNVSSRPRTASSVPWTPAPWNIVGEAGPPQRTPDLKAIVQELVDRPTWASGSAMVFIITGTGRRTAEAFESGVAGAALLHVEYE